MDFFVFFFCAALSSALIPRNKKLLACQFNPNGCCPDMKATASGPFHEGCSCRTFKFGCCDDGKTIAEGPCKEGCCKYTTYGCCPDRRTAALGPKMDGCGNRPGEGDKCYLGNDMCDGKCVHQKECLDNFQDSLMRDQFQQNCQSNVLTPLVCCQDNRIIHPTSHSVEQTTTEQPQRISRRKCLEYTRKESQSLAHNSQDILTNSVSEECFKFVKLVSYVMGGARAEEGEFPHMAALGYRKENKIEFMCGGSLISNFYVLTAAHCLSTDSGPVILVRLGETSFIDNEDKYPQEDFEVSDSVSYPQYRSSVLYHDLGLLRLKRSAAYLWPRVRPACLPQPGDMTTKLWAVATGWGHTGDQQRSSEHLLKVMLKIVEYQKCFKAYNPLRRINQSPIPSGLIRQQMCAGAEEKKDTCQGDSGGPLQIFLRSLCAYEVIGVTSFGSVCGTGVPSIYTSVSDYVEWIEGIVWKGE